MERRRGRETSSSISTVSRKERFGISRSSVSHPKKRGKRTLGGRELADSNPETGKLSLH